MKAIVVKEFGGPEVLEVVEVADPVAGAGQVLVDIHAAGVNPVETYVRSGKYPRLPELPYTPGSDGAGVVAAIGEGVDNVHVGDRVYIYGSLTGTYAEKALCLSSQVYPLPDRLTTAQGAALGVPYGAAWRALFHRGKAQKGETVLIHGATGAVGIATVQFALAAGLNVIATAGSERGRLLVHKQGAHHVLTHEDANDPVQIRKITDGRGVDIIIEMLANVNLAKDLGNLAKYGRVVIVGSRGPIEIDPRMTMTLDADIRGMTLMNATPEELQEMHRAFAVAIADGTIHPVIDEKVPLAEAPRAHVDVLQGESYGKIVLTP